MIHREALLVGATSVVLSACATGASQTPLTDGWSIVRDLGVGEPRSGQRGLVAPPDAEVVYLRHTG